MFQGRFSPFLLEGPRPSKLHLIDPWFHLTPEWHWGEGSRNTIDAVVTILQSNRAEIESGRLVVHIGDDLRLLEGFDDASLDWAYIDSSHAYQHTVDELDVLRRKVRPGGVVAGDDWRPDPTHRHHGVCKAVREATEQGLYEFIDADEATAQWAIRYN